MPKVLSCQGNISHSLPQYDRNFCLIYLHLLTPYQPLPSFFSPKAKNPSERPIAANQKTVSKDVQTTKILFWREPILVRIRRDKKKVGVLASNNEERVSISMTKIRSCVPIKPLKTSDEKKKLSTSN